MAVDTGHGASVSFGGGGGTYKCRKITMPERRVPMVDTTYLGTLTMRTMMPGDLAEFGTAVAEILYEGSMPTPGAAAQTITITLPGGSTLAGTAVVNRIKYPVLETNTLQVAEIEWTYDGTTPPAV